MYSSSSTQAVNFGRFGQSINFNRFDIISLATLLIIYRLVICFICYNSKKILVN